MWQAHSFSPRGLGISGGALPGPGTMLALDWVDKGGERRAFQLRARVARRDDDAAELEIVAGPGQLEGVQALYTALLEAFLSGG
jgi:hypothetical protein